MNGNYDFDNYEPNDRSDSYDTNHNTNYDTNYDTNSTYFDESAISGKNNNNAVKKQSEEELRKEKNASTVSLVLGLYTLISLFVCCGMFNTVTGIIGIVYSVKAKNLSAGKVMPTNAKVGLICSIIGLAIKTLGFLFFIIIIVFSTL